MGSETSHRVNSLICGCIGGNAEVDVAEVVTVIGSNVVVEVQASLIPC